MGAGSHIQGHWEPPRGTVSAPQSCPCVCVKDQASWHSSPGCSEYSWLSCSQVSRIDQTQMQVAGRGGLCECFGLRDTASCCLAPGPHHGYRHLLWCPAGGRCWPGSRVASDGASRALLSLALLTREPLLVCTCHLPASSLWEPSSLHLWCPHKVTKSHSHPIAYRGQQGWRQMRRGSQGFLSQPWEGAVKWGWAMDPWAFTQCDNTDTCGHLTGHSPPSSWASGMCACAQGPPLPSHGPCEAPCEGRVPQEWERPPTGSLPRWL